jgi:hypothetical protein
MQQRIHVLHEKLKPLIKELRKKDKVGQKKMGKGQARTTKNGKGHLGFLYSLK